MKSQLIFLLVALGLFSPRASIAQSTTNFPATAIVQLADKKTADRGRLAEEIARFTSSASDRTDLQRRVKDLIPFLKDEDDTVRYWVAMALGHIGAPAKDAVPFLIVALDERADTRASKSSESGIRFALDRIDQRWRSRPDVSKKIKSRWPDEK